MDVKALRYVVAIADSGSLSKAARAVHVTQPSLSRQLGRLERELGLLLFSRESGRLVLTPAGRRFVPVAREVVARFDQGVAAIQELGQSGDLTITVAAHATTIDDVVAPFAAGVADGVVLNLREEATHELTDVVRTGGADLAVSALPSTAELSCRLVWRFPLYACVSADHRFSGRRSVSLREVLEEPLILLDEGAVSRRVFDDAVAETGVPYRIRFEVSLSRAAQALAAASRGVAILSDEPRFSLSAIPLVTGTGPLTLALFALWDPAHYAAEQIGGLVETLTSYCEAHFVRMHARGGGDAAPLASPPIQSPPPKPRTA